MCMYHSETSVIQFEVTATRNIQIGDKILLEYNPVLMQCTLRVLANQRLPYPKRLDCPVTGCHSCNLKKLSNHLIQVHDITNKAKRKKLLQKAKRVSKHVCIYNKTHNHASNCLEKKKIRDTA